MLLHAVLVASILLLVNFLAYVYSFCEQRLVAKTQQRLGPNRAGWLGIFQSFADYRKAMQKSGSDSFFVSGLMPALGFFLMLLFPYLFLLILLYPLRTVQEGLGGFPSLFIVLFLSVTVENLFVFAFRDSTMRLRVKRQELLTMVGVTIFLLASIVPLLRLEAPTLLEISRAQAEVPYFMMFQSPFIFLAGAIAFLAVFFIVPSPPVAGMQPRAFSGIRQNLYSLTRVLWTIGIFGLWVTLFFGGNAMDDFGTLALIFFFAKLTLVVLGFLWVRRSFPAMRVEDSLEFGFKRMLPACVIAILGEMIWLAIGKI